MECTILDTARWRSKGTGSKENNGKRLVPRKNSYVSITGFITGRCSTAGNKCFCVEVDSMVFLGRPTVPGTSQLASPLAGATSNEASPGHSNLKFDFSQLRNKKRHIETALPRVLTRYILSRIILISFSVLESDIDLQYLES